MLGEKGFRKIHQIRNDAVLCIRPEGGKLKAVAGFSLDTFPGGCRLPDMVETGAVGIILGIGAIGNDKNLHILKKPRGRPEALPLVAVDLVERLPDGDAPAFEFNMYHGQAVDQNRYIIAVFMSSFRDGILVDDLQAVVVDVPFIQQIDIFRRAVVPAEDLDIIVLNTAGFLHDPIVFPRDAFREKLLPLAVGKNIVVEQFKLFAQVGNQRLFVVNGKIFMPLRCQQADKLLFQRRLALVGVRFTRLRRILRHNGAFGCLGNDVVVAHVIGTSLNVKSLSR